MSHLADPARLERDRALIQRIAADDPHALGDLMRLYGQWLVDVAFGVVQSDELAQEVVQDVFFRIWDRRYSLQIQTSVAAFLYRSVSNRAIDVAKHERVHRRVKDTLADHETAFPRVSENAGALTLDYQELRSAVDIVLQRLPARTRDIFLMRVDQGLEYSEIAEICGVTVAVAYRQVSQAIKYLVRRVRI